MRTLRSVVEVHDKNPVPRPVLAKLENQVLRYDKVRYIQDPSQGLDTVLKEIQNITHTQVVTAAMDYLYQGIILQNRGRNGGE